MQPVLPFPLLLHGTKRINMTQPSDSDPKRANDGAIDPTATGIVCEDVPNDATGLFDVAPATPLDMLGPNRPIGPYVLKKEIGRGAMGAVYEAEHTKLRRRVALKILPTEFTAVPSRLARFQREMEAIGRLDHENIVRAHDAGEFNGTHYLSMELIEGIDVQKMSKLVGYFDVGSACEIARQTALGLQHIAENNLVHRDIKPSNLLINSSGTVKILDLGIVRLRRDENADSSQTSMGSMIGTPDYMAPEQIESSLEVDIRADIYSLGCTLYTLLAGRPPFHGKDFETQMSKLMAHVKQDPPLLSEVADQIPHGLVQLVHRFMAKDVNDRIQTPLEAANALSEWADHESLNQLRTAVADGDSDVREYQAARDTGKGASSTSSATSSKVKWSLIGLAGAVLIALFATGPDSEETNNDVQASSRHVTPTSDSAATDTLPVGSAGNQSNAPLQPSHTATVTVTNDSLEVIAGNTSAIADNSAKVLESTNKINDNTERIADSLEGLGSALRMATRSADIVAEPKSTGEFFHNAQAYQHQGNVESARQMYLSILERGDEFVDVHQQFLSLLSSQYDEAEVRDIYAALPGDHTNSVRRYVTSLITSDAAERKQMLANLLKDDPQFALAAYEMSRIYSAAALGRQGLADKANERKWLLRFREISKQRSLSEYFLDATKGTEVSSDAAQRWVALRDLDSNVFESPVTANLMATRGATTIMISIGEPTTEIRYRIDQTGEFKSTGYLSVLNPATGKKAPKSLVMLPPNSRPMAIEIEYTDVRNQTQGPHLIELGDRALEQDSRNKLDLMSTFWIKFVHRRGKDFIEMQTLAAYRDVIKQVRYGLNVKIPDQTFELADPRESGLRNRIVLDDSQDEVKFASIQLEYTDGTKSPVQIFERAAHQR